MVDRRPCKRIVRSEHVDAFRVSKSLEEADGFLRALGEAARGRDVERKYEGGDEGVRAMIALVDKAEARLDAFPPVRMNNRYGNASFREWLAAVRASSVEDCRGLLSEKHCNELAGYWWNAWGNFTRLDYGTGHEASFFIFLFAAYQAKCVKDLAGLALSVLPRYLEVAFRVQSLYRLEPAGSHGVWSLDDYHFLPFLIGSAQLCAPAEMAANRTGGGRKTASSPKVIRDKMVVDTLAKSNLYCRALQRILELKTGAFQEHSPLLFDISSHVKTWEDVRAGLERMYRAEVLLKFPVAQHFLFGSLFPHSWELSAQEIAALDEAADAPFPSESDRKPQTVVPGSSVPGSFPSPFKSPFSAAVKGGGDALVNYFNIQRKPLFGAGGISAGAGAPVGLGGIDSVVNRPSSAGASYQLINENGIRIKGWEITTNKTRISSDDELESLSASHVFNGSKVDFPPPEMMFGANFARFKHVESGITLEFNALDGASGCKIVRDAHGKADRTLFKLPISERWAKRKDLNGTAIKEWREDYDWTYTTTYAGSYTKSSTKGQATPPPLTKTKEMIDYELLKQREPILFFDTVPLFEDDLFDFGESKLTVKLRVMDSCFFALARFWLRVDNTFLRCFDTRVFHRYATSSLLVEVTRKEATFEQLGLTQANVKELLAEDAAEKKLPVVSTETFAIALS